MALSVKPARWEKFPAVKPYYEFNEEFDREFTVGSADRWTGTALSSGTAVLTTDEEFGVIKLSGAATTDNSGYQIQANMESFTVQAGKEIYFESRCFKISDATESHVAIGLALTDTTLLDGADGIAGNTSADFIGFYKIDGSALLYFVCKEDSAIVVQNSIATLAADTYYTLGFQIRPDANDATKGNITVVINGAPLGTIYVANMPGVEEVLCPSASFVTGDNTGTKTCFIDYIDVLVER